MKHRVENETNKAKIETKKGSENQCSTLRNILTKEKFKDKSPPGQFYVEAHHEEVQGRELRGQGNLERTHRSHRDEEARELHFAGCTGPVLWRGATRISRSTTLQIFTSEGVFHTRCQSRRTGEEACQKPQHTRSTETIGVR